MGAAGRKQTMELLAGGEFGVYVHWPFCAAKCPYCDFNSHVRREPPDQARFVAAYEREIAHAAQLAPGRRVDSVFFGGGTPSLMAPATVGAILAAIGRAWPLAGDCEITLEANPSSADASRFAGYRAAGVNRLSLGVQSFEDAQLRFLGRLHNAAEAVAAIELARKHFPRISFDLIYARPGQEPAAWLAELGQARALAADHLSLYQLTVEPGTPFHDLAARGKLAVPDSDRAAELYEATLEAMAAAGMPAYEISNHAVAGAECRHNLVYWRYCDYAGIGPGAHGRLTVGGAKLATVAARKPEDWLARAERDGHGWEIADRLTAEEMADECLLMGLRLAEGMDLARHAAIGGRQIDPARIAFLADKGFLEMSAAGRLRATRQGFLLLDAVVADLAA
jgi:oxygen-independent coproporphyrinogen-3 oxidase